jgi:tetratricopeptide (TPR) repeat protein
VRNQQSQPRKIKRGQIVLAAFIIGWFGLSLYLLDKLPPASERHLPVHFPHVSLDTNSPYAGSDTCKDCHRTEYDLWVQSHHALAERFLQTAADQIAFGPSRSFKHGSDATTVRLEKGEYQIITRGLDGQIRPYPVVRVIGDDPLVQFLTPFPGGRHQVQEASYDPNANQWFYVYGNDLRFPGEFGHWTGRGMNWNSFCAECHNTRLHKNYNTATDSYHTTMAEMAVGCEACHGPLKAHNEWQKAHPNTTLRDPTVSRLSPARLVGMCGSCHSRNTDLTENFQPGDSFYDRYSLEILDYDQRWYPDGQIKDEDYEFEALLGSKMYQDGVTCLDCHNAHSYKNTLQGNALCMRCHNGSYPKAPAIDPLEHGHHKLSNAGSDCIGCHMPVTVYMQRHPRRDHGFTIPDPLLTKELGIPNACNRCHSDQTTDWALQYTEQWYGQRMSRPTRERARWIAAAENGEAGAKDKLIGLLADTNQPPYWRAVAATFLEQWANDLATKTALLSQLKNAHPLVRERVVRSLEPAAQDLDVRSALEGMLNDPLRNVRAAAAWVLRATVDMHSRAGKDLQRMLDLESDQPTGQFEAATFWLARQQPAEALVHLKKATAWDPISPPFLCAQAEVQNQLGQLTEALKTLDHAESAVPNDPHIPDVRALILTRNGRYDEARRAANQALKIQPGFQPAVELLQNLPATH